MTTNCDYRKAECSALGLMVGKRWICNNHAPKVLSDHEHALAEKDAEIARLPTREWEHSLQMALREKNRQLVEQARELERLRGALGKVMTVLPVYVNGGNPNSPYKEGINPFYVMGSKEVLDVVQAALATPAATALPQAKEE